MRKAIAAFITVNRRNDQSGNDDKPNQPIMSTTAAAAEVNDVRDSDFTHSSEIESEEEQTMNKAAASSVENDRPEQAAVVTAATEEDDPVLIYKDVGYINFSATGQSSIGQLLKEAMVRQGYDCFQNADAKEEFGSKATVRCMTQNWIVKQLKNGIFFQERAKCIRHAKKELSVSVACCFQAATEQQVIV